MSAKKIQSNYRCHFQKKKFEIQNNLKKKESILLIKSLIKIPSENIFGFKYYSLMVYLLKQTMKLNWIMKEFHNTNYYECYSDISKEIICENIHSLEIHREILNLIKKLIPSIFIKNEVICFKDKHNEKEIISLDEEENDNESLQNDNKSVDIHDPVKNVYTYSLKHKNENAKTIQNFYRQILAKDVLKYI